jgi:hypothetical protein
MFDAVQDIRPEPYLTLAHRSVRLSAPAMALLEGHRFIRFSVDDGSPRIRMTPTDDDDRDTAPVSEKTQTFSMQGAVTLFHKREYMTGIRYRITSSANPNENVLVVDPEDTVASPRDHYSVVRSLTGSRQGQRG